METGISLYRVHIGEPGGVVLLPGLRETVKEGSENGASLSMWAVRGKLGGRRPLLGILNDICSLSGHNPGLLLASLLDITP